MRTQYRNAIIVGILFLAASAGAQEGTQAQMAPDQLQSLGLWAQSSQSQLREALGQVKSMDRVQARDFLQNVFIQISKTGESQPAETLLRYTLNRALKLSDLAGSAGQNSSSVELQMRMLWISAEFSSQIVGVDFSKSAEFGVTESEFIFSWSEGILNPAIQYQAQQIALGYLSYDLSRDNQSQTFAPEIGEIAAFLAKADAEKQKNNNLPQKIVAARSLYSLELLHLKGEARLGDVIGDPANPSLDFYKKSLTKNLSDPDLNTRLRAVNGFGNLSLGPSDEIQIANLLADASFTVCSAALQVLRKVDPMPAGSEDGIYAAIIGQPIRECRDAGIILLGRARTARAQELLNLLVHSNCLDSDVSLLTRYALNVSNAGPGSDLLSESTQFCAGDSCVGDWIAIKSGNTGVQGPIVQVDNSGKVLMGTQAGNYWVKTKDAGKRVACFQNVCTDDYGMLNEAGGRKVGNALKRLGVGLLPMSQVYAPDYGESQEAPFHTFFVVSAVFDNGLILLNEINDGALQEWTTTDRFQKDGGGGDSPPERQCYVPAD